MPGRNEREREEQKERDRRDDEEARRDREEGAREVAREVPEANWPDPD